MYKVIDGHKYDTQTAREMATWEPNPCGSDFTWFAEVLYRTKTGLYFLYGVGNAASRYAESCGQNEWCGGEKITPMTETRAKAWVEEHCSGQTYERIFGDPEGPEESKKLTVVLPAKDAERLAAIKAATGKSYTELISKWIWEQEL